MQQTPSVADIVRWVVVVALGIAHVNSAVDAQPVHVVFVKPHCDIVEDKLPDFWPAEIRTPAPRRIAALVVVEVNPAAIIFVPAVKLPEVSIAVEVVVDNV